MFTYVLSWYRHLNDTIRCYCSLVVCSLVLYPFFLVFLGIIVDFFFSLDICTYHLSTTGFVDYKYYFPFTFFRFPPPVLSSTFHLFSAHCIALCSRGKIFEVLCKLKYKSRNIFQVFLRPFTFYDQIYCCLSRQCFDNTFVFIRIVCKANE